MDDALGPDGPIARRMRRYEDRPAQRALAGEVAALYNEGGVGLLEAGTGVGKSMGYLVPALRWAAANGERTVVSTATIALQEQLVGKDLPFLAGALTDQKVRFALLKGWRNYLCLARLEVANAGGAALFEPGMRAELETIRAWADRTSDGSVADLPTPPRAEVWDEVAAEPDVCTRTRCAHFDKCFLFKARRAAAEADVIVVNHHLLLSDVAVRRTTGNWEDAAVLPAYKRLVVDEGHHLEDAAAAHLGASVTRRALQRAFGRLDRKGKGLLGALTAKLAERTDLLSTASLDLVEARLVPAAHAARDHANLVFDLLQAWLERQGQPVVRLTDAFAGDPVWQGGLAGALDGLLAEVELLHDGLRLVRERLETDERRLEALAPLLAEVRAVAKRLQGAGDGLRRALKPGEQKEPTVRWVELRGKERNVVVSSVPARPRPGAARGPVQARRHRRGDERDAHRRRRASSPSSPGRLGLTAPDFSPAHGGAPVAVRLPRAGAARGAVRRAGSQRERRRTPARRGPPRPRPVRRERRRRVRPVHQPQGRARGGRRAARAWRRPALAAARPRRGRARRAAAPLPRERPRRAVGHRLVLGGRRRARRRAAGAGHRQAAVPRAERAGDRRAVRGDRAPRRRQLPRLHAPARGAAPQAGVRAARAHGRRPRRGGALRPAGGDEGLRPRPARRAPARAPGRRAVAPRAGRRRGVLRGAPGSRPTRDPATRWAPAAPPTSRSGSLPGCPTAPRRCTPAPRACAPGSCGLPSARPRRSSPACPASRPSRPAS
jgi:hypothetical protein